MGFERPQAWALALVALPLLWWWHRHRTRPRRASVSSLELWRAAAGEIASRARRRSATLALALEMAFAMGLIAALAGPISRSSDAAPRWRIILDRRPSMGAAHASGGTRLDEARRRLRRTIERVGASGSTEVITVPPSDGRLTVDDLGAVRAATAPAAPRSFADVVDQARASGDPVIVVTDRPRPAADGVEEWLDVADAARNVGLVWAIPEATGISVGVMNGGHVRETRTLTMSVAGRDDVRWPIDVAPGEVRVVRTGPVQGTARLTLSGGDVLRADDAVVVVPGARVQIVATEPLPAAVRRALRALDVPLVDVTPAAARADGPAFFWRALPTAPWRAPLLLVDPPSGTWDDLVIGRRFVVHRVEPGGAARTPAARPAHVERARRITAPVAWAVRQRAIDGAGRAGPSILERGETTVAAFHPIDDAPGWSTAVSTPTFPAFFFAAFRSVVAKRTRGLLSPRDTRLVSPDAERAPSSSDAPSHAGMRMATSHAWGRWALLLALLAFVARLWVDRR